MQEPKYYLEMILWDLKKTFKTFQKTSKFKGNAQFVKNKTFGLWEKNDNSTPKNVLQDTNERTCDYLR